MNFEYALAGPGGLMLILLVVGLLINAFSYWLYNAVRNLVVQALEENDGLAGDHTVATYAKLLYSEAMRGKFRNSYEKPEPFVPGQVTEVSWTLPDVCHTFRRGHRVMVQVQSSWFPLVDLNPQTFCDIYRAGPADFRKATHRVVLGGARPSVLQVRVLPAHP